MKSVDIINQRGYQRRRRLSIFASVQDSLDMSQ